MRGIPACAAALAFAAGTAIAHRHRAPSSTFYDAAQKKTTPLSFMPSDHSCHHAMSRPVSTHTALSGHCGARALRKFGLLLETLSPPTWPGTSCSHAATTIVDDAAAREPAALSFLLQSEKYIRQRTILSMYDADAYLPVPICISLYSDLMVMLYINHQHQTPS